MGNQHGTDHHKTDSDVLKVLLTGDSITQKSGFLFAYQQDTPLKEGDYIPTVCDNYSTKIKFHDHEFTIVLYDNSSGQESFDPSLRNIVYPDTSVHVLLFSLTDRESYDNVFNKWLPEIWRNSHAPIVLLGTHKEERDKDPENSKFITTKEAKDASEPFSVLYQELDFKDLKGIKNLFEVTLPDVYSNKSFDKKKELIKKNIHTFEDYDKKMSKLKVELAQTKNSNEPTDKVEKKIQDEHKSYFEKMFPLKK